MKGVGSVRGNALKKYGIENIGHLLHHFPRHYIDRTKVKLINEIKLGERVVIIGKVESFGIKYARKRRFFQVNLSDSTGSFTCVWFNSLSWIVDKFSLSDKIAVFGKVEFHQGIQIIHPEFDILDENEDPVNTGKILAQYPSTAELKSVGLESRGFRKIINTSFETIKNNIQDYFPKEFRETEGICHLHKALKQIHCPISNNSLENSIYRLTAYGSKKTSK